MSWKILSSRQVYACQPFLSVYRQTVKLPNGEEIDDYHQLTMPDTVLVMGITITNEVITLNGYRHGVGEATRTFPGGVIEVGESPLAAAKRELLEETGYSGGEWTSLGNFVHLSNYGGGKSYLFKAVRLEKTHDVDSGDLEDSVVETIERPGVLKKIRDGEFKSLSSLGIVALGLDNDFLITDN